MPTTAAIPITNGKHSMLWPSDPRSNMKDALDPSYKALPLVYERFSESSSPSVLEVDLPPVPVGEVRYAS
jgi:hypothetical protein